jgi:outer membrane lipoprotein carrier protein
MLGVCVVLAAFVVAQAMAAEESAEEIVRRVQERYDATADFTADVYQEMRLTSSEKLFTAHGTVAFKRPGRMRWELDNHERQIIVADGKTLWFYQPEEQQVLKAPFEAAFRSTTPISFLSGIGRITEDFEVTLDDVGEDHAFLVLEPRQGGGEFGHLRLVVERRSHDITGAEIRDPLGNVTRLIFSNMKRNLDLEESKFEFAVPRGVDVIEAPIGY